MANKVVQRLSEPTQKSATPVSETAHAVQSKFNYDEGKEKLQKKEEELSETDTEVQQKPIFESNAEPEADVQAKFVEHSISTIQRSTDTDLQEEQVQEKEEELSEADAEVQQKPIFESNAEPEADVQAKLVDHSISTVQRSADTDLQEEQIQEKEEELSEADAEVQQKPIFESNAVPEADVQAKPNIFRKPEEKPPEEEAPVQLKKQIQTKSNEESTGSSALQSQLNSSKGKGSPLSDTTRSSMESAFGADFSSVRVHTGSDAVQMNKDLGAQAFTHGSDIYFNKNKYDTNSNSGNHLLAHELTHTIQQGGAVRQKPQKSYQRTQPKVQRFLGRLWKATKKIGRSAWSGLKKVGSSVVKAVSKGVDWILKKISPILKRIPGYSLLTVILGKDIITGDQVERNGPNLIKGFVGLIPGGHDLWLKLEESKMITGAFSWLEGEISKLGLSWSSIKNAFKTAASSLSVTDVFSPIDAFNTKIKPVFAPILAKILTLAKKVVKKVSEFILEGFLRLAGPFGKKVMDILRKAGNTFWTIVGDPMGFLDNLIRAVKSGVFRFRNNIKTHLIGGLVSWLTGAMGDLPIQIPQNFDVKGVLHLGLQVMGVTWQNIRHKLVKRIGEPMVKAAETGVSLVKTIITQGPMGLWGMLKEKAVEIKQTIMGGIRNWVITQLVKQGIIKILNFLNPAGILVEAALAIYNGIMFFVNNWQRIVDFVNSIFSSIGQIALGNIVAAAGFIEKAMARSIPIILNFVARLLNIGSISKAIQRIITRIRKPIDKVISRAINFIVSQVRKLFGRGKKKKAGKYTEKDRKAARKAIPFIEKTAAKDGKVSNEESKKTASAAKKKHPVIQSITPVLNNDTYDYNVIFRQKDKVETPLLAEEEKEDDSKSMKRLQKKRNVLKGKFKKKEYQNSFSPELTDKQGRQDLELGLARKIITKTGNGKATKYEFNSMTEAEIIQLGTKESTKNARSNTTLKKESGFTIKEFQSYLLNIQELPNDKKIITETIASKIISNLKANKEVVEKEGKNLFTFSEIPTERKLPEAWKKAKSGSGRSDSAINIRNKYYLNGADPSWDGARKQVIERDLGDLEEAITKLDSNNTSENKEGQELWEDLKTKQIVPDEDYNGKGLSYYKSMKREVDHEPPMAKHWVKGGYNSLWSSRQKYSTNVDKTLTYILKSKNSEKQGDGHNYVKRWYVGPDFTGPGSSKGPQWADESTLFENMKNFKPKNK